jgi:molecular chaperone Hsp33
MQMQGNGQVKLLVVECNSDMTMRATAKWDGELATASLPALLGDGRFVITIDPKQGGQTYQGIVSLDGDTVAEVLQNYMSRSEQLATRLWLASNLEHTAGMLLQRLPGDDHGDEDAWNRAQQLGATITSQELLGLPAVEIIRRLYHEEDIRVFESHPISFRCSCSRERVADMLRMLGYAEVQSILLERNGIEVGCEFCNRLYVFDRVDAEQLFAAEVITPAGPELH